MIPVKSYLTNVLEFSGGINEQVTISDPADRGFPQDFTAYLPPKEIQQPWDSCLHR